MSQMRWETGAHSIIHSPVSDVLGFSGIPGISARQSGGKPAPRPLGLGCSATKLGLSPLPCQGLRRSQNGRVSYQNIPRTKSRFDRSKTGAWRPPPAFGSPLRCAGARSP
jgi:hypothetical protein